MEHEGKSLTMLFLHFQLQNRSNPINDDVVLPDLLDCPISVFHHAVATFYAPSDLSSLGGMHSETIHTTPTWCKGPACYNTVFLEKDLEIPGMGGLHLGRVFLFFFISNLTDSGTILNIWKKIWHQICWSEISEKFWLLKIFRNSELFRSSDIWCHHRWRTLATWKNIWISENSLTKDLNFWKILT